MFKEEDNQKIMDETLALKKQHISLFSNNEEVHKYTKMLKTCVHDITETTVIVPHLRDKDLIDSKLDALNDKINDLQRVFGYKKIGSKVTGDGMTSIATKHRQQDLVKQGEEQFGVKLSFQY